MSQKVDIEFLADLLVDPGIITGDSSHCNTEVGKKAIEIYNQFETHPHKINFGQLQDLVSSEGSQIGNPGPYLAHLANTAGVLRSLVLQLGKVHPDLDLPTLERAYAMGLVHDLNATFSDYKKGGQQSKEFDEFVLAKGLGWKQMEQQVAMHSDYLGAIRLMSQGVTFPKEGAYVAMKKVLQSDGLLSYQAIEEQFQGFIDGKENLSLILLTVADYMATDQPHFDLNRFDDDFLARSADIVWRYHGKAMESGQTPSLLGQALVNGGIERIGRYQELVSTLFKGAEDKIFELKSSTALWR